VARQLSQSSGARLTYGVSHELMQVQGAPGNRSQKVGIIVARRLASRPPGLRFPSLGLRISYYLEDPQRRGQLGASLGVSVERRR